MKLLSLLFLLTAVQSFACPNFSGKFNDEDGVLIEFTQTGCTKILMFSDRQETLMQLDGISRPHQKGVKQDSFMSSKIENDTLIIENTIKAKNQKNDDYIYKMVMTYKFASQDKLQETTQLRNADGMIQSVEESTLTRKK